MIKSFLTGPKEFKVMMRSRNTILSTLCMVICVIILAAGCGNPLNERQVASIQPLGLTDCYDCHVDANVTLGVDAVFEEWVQSRHANFDTADSTGDMANRPDPLDSSGYTYADIVGLPGITRSPFFNTDNSCSPCHMGPIDNGDHAGAIFTSNVAGVLFSDPNLGEVERYVIGCETCHEVGHFNGASSSEATVVAFDKCGPCHGLAGDDHHSVDGYRYWLNASSVNALHDSNVPDVASTVTIGSNEYEVWQLATSSNWYDTSDTINSTAYDGPYFFDGGRTIRDSHFDEVWITNEDDKLTKYISQNGKFGYVDTTNSSPNTGMVRSDSAESCTASCHKPHQFNNFVNEQWFNGAHRPAIEGPLSANWSGAVVPSGPANWAAVDYNRLGASCQRCHSSNGFAEIAPGFGDAVLTATPGGSFITCNACHDGQNYAEPGDKHLRFSGNVTLYDYKGNPLAYVAAGNGAVCVYCHQGREDGSHIDDDIAAGTPGFNNMHYLAAGAMLYAKKGYEYSGNVYQSEHTFHAMVGCTGCHMTDTGSKTLGGHTFHMVDGVAENTGLCTSSCHPGMTALDDPVEFAHTQDWDGNGGTISSKDEVAYLLTVLLHNAIEAYDSPADADTAPNIYHQSGYPYFGTNTGQDWDGPLASAAFNWQYVTKEPGAFAHNPKYAVQLLRDSYNDLLINDSSLPALGGTRP